MPTNAIPVFKIYKPASVVTDGSIRFVPCRLTREIDSGAAIRLLGYKWRGCLDYLKNHPIAGRIIKWRYLTPGKGKVLWDADSIDTYLQLTKGRRPFSRIRGS